LEEIVREYLHDVFHYSEWAKETEDLWPLVFNFSIRKDQKFRRGRK
jgi:hypothetical protein